MDQQHMLLIVSPSTFAVFCCAPLPITPVASGDIWVEPREGDGRLQVVTRTYDEELEDDLAEQIVGRWASVYGPQTTEARQRDPSQVH